MKFPANIKSPDFWDKEFRYGNSCLTRSELDGMPCPICGAFFTDNEMKKIVKEIEINTKIELGHSVDFDEDKDREIWWENMEQIIMNEHKGVYFEDLTEWEQDEYNLTAI